MGHFGNSFFVGFVPSATAWAATMVHLKVVCAYPSTPGHLTTLEGKNGEITCLVTVGAEQDASAGVNISSLILHEAVHVFQALCEKIGEREPSAEFEAYTIQHAYAGLMDAYCVTRRNIFSQAKKPA